MRFVVTGTGRSGTGFAAALMRSLGVSCGHEEVFGPERGLFDPPLGPRPRRPLRLLRAEAGRVATEVRRRRTPLEGDASWMAVPRLGRFGGASFLQVRHPLAVISSFQGTRFFAPERRWQPQPRFAMAFFDPVGDPVLDAMRWWVFWNGWAERHADLVYRLEDLDADLVARLVALAGIVPVRSASEALAATGTDVNSGRRRGHESPPLGWDALPDGPDLQALLAATRHFGYRDP